MQNQRLLIVDDDADLAFGLQLNMEIEGFDVCVATDGAQATAAYNSLSPNVVILDLMLPDIDGLDLLRGWRENDQHTPVIVLSARDAETTRVAAFRVGATDFVAKPFSLLELIERTKLHGRRALSIAPESHRIVLGDTVIDFGSRSITRSGHTSSLTPKELELLQALIAARGAVLSKETILRDVWHYPTIAQTNTLEFHIASLRHKIEPNPHLPQYLLTVRKAGYRLRKPQS